MPAKGSSPAHGTITNKCNARITVAFCHSPSSAPGTRDTECGFGGKYYQQFPLLDPGEVVDNYFSLPAGTTVSFGACFAGRGGLKHSKDGHYGCPDDGTKATEAPPAEAPSSSLLDMADKADRQDKLDLRSALDRAEQCTTLQCVTDALAAASKVAFGSSDRKLIVAARERADARVGFLRAEEEIRQKNIAQAEQRNSQEAARAAQATEAEQNSQAQAAQIQSGILKLLGGAAAAAIVGGSRSSAQPASRPAAAQTTAPASSGRAPSPAARTSSSGSTSPPLKELDLRINPNIILNPRR